MWQVMIESLGKRTPPTSDEVRDKHSAELKRQRLEAIQKTRAQQGMEQTALTEKKILAVTKRVKLVCVDDLRDELKMTAHHLRTVANKMVEDGRLSIVLGSYGKKYWKLNAIT